VIQLILYNWHQFSAILFISFIKFLHYINLPTEGWVWLDNTIFNGAL